MKNYYEILEVDKNASDEIIKVAYKSLVKKFHPDLKSGEERNIAEQKIKEINEAYDILSDPYQRHEYDKTLIEDRVSREDFNFVLKENFMLKEQLSKYENWYSNQTQNNNSYKSNNSYTKNYADSNYGQKQYHQNQASNYNKAQNVNNKKTGIFSGLDDTLKTLIAVLLTFLIIFLVLKIPFINSLLSDFLGNGMALAFALLLVGYIIFFRGKK